MAWTIKGNANLSNNRGSKSTPSSKTSGSTPSSTPSKNTGGSSGGNKKSSLGSLGPVGAAIGVGIANTIAANLKNNRGSSSGSSSGGSSSGGSSSGSSYGGTTSNVGTSATPDWLKQAQANSKAWHTADAATKKTLEEKNRALYGSHNYTYDSKTGTWSAPKTSSNPATSVGNFVGGVLSTGLNAYNQLKNQNNNHSTIPSVDYKNTDLGNTFWQAVNGGSTDIDYLQSIADERLKKAQTNSNLNQYVQDQNQLAMQAYINQLKKTQEYADQYNQYYEDAIAKQQDAYTQAAEQAAAQYRQLMPTMNQSYDDAARQAYINYRTAQRDLPAQLAAAGISGQGAAESSMVAQNAAYNSAYNQNEQARANALANLENQAANAYNTTANQGLQSVADLMAQQANAQQNILAQQEQMRQNAIGNLYNYNTSMGYSGGTPTLDAQSVLANIAYNKNAQQMQQSQYEQSLASDQKNANRDYFLNLWAQLGTRGATPEVAAALNIPVGAVANQGKYNSNYY